MKEILQCEFSGVTLVLAWFLMYAALLLYLLLLDLLYLPVCLVPCPVDLVLLPLELVPDPPELPLVVLLVLLCLGLLRLQLLKQTHTLRQFTPHLLLLLVVLVSQRLKLE